MAKNVFIMNFNAPVGRQVDKVEKMDVNICPNEWISWKDNPPPRDMPMDRTIAAIYWSESGDGWEVNTLFWDDEQNAWARDTNGDIDKPWQYWVWLPKLPADH